MALLTPLDERAARAVLAEYGLQLESLEPLPAKGTVNSNFRVRASGRAWFLRVNEGKRDADVEAEARLIARLRAGGLPTPEATPTRAGALFSHAAGKPVTLFPWVAGHEAAPDPARPSTVAVVGRALALLHRAGSDLAPEEAPRNHYTLDELERRLASFDGDGRFAALAPELAEQLRLARLSPPAPSGLIHQDLFPDNLLVDAAGELSAVLDLEQATFGPYAYDLAVSANAWCWDGREIRREALDRLLEAYERAAGPLVEPRPALFAFGALAAARFTITRITDVFLPAGVDEELRRRKDYREYAARLAWWRSHA